MSIETTPQEIAIVQAQVQEARLELLQHAHALAMRMGFADRHARFVAVTTMFLGSAQLYALSIHGGQGLYEIFKAMCAVMAGSDAAAVVRDSQLELGPEAFGEKPGLIFPPGVDIKR